MEDKQEEKYYIIECKNLPIENQEKTLDELLENIKEKIEPYLEGKNLEELEEQNRTVKRDKEMRHIKDIFIIIIVIIIEFVAYLLIGLYIDSIGKFNGPSRIFFIVLTILILTILFTLFLVWYESFKMKEKKIFGPAIYFSIPKKTKDTQQLVNYKGSEMLEQEAKYLQYIDTRCDYRLQRINFWHIKETGFQEKGNRIKLLGLDTIKI